MDPFSGMKRNQPGDVGDSSKRQRTDGPSKVLHVRGLPQYTTEAELQAVVAPFGLMQKCFIVENKNQAFVQMDSIDTAQQLLNNLEYAQPSIRSKAIYFQFSSRTEIENQPSSGGAGGSAMPGAMGGVTNVLLITVSNVAVPVTLDNIYSICKPYGEVLKIITFTKSQDFQALVQMDNLQSAIAAKTFLEGKDMFQGCCHLRVGFSNRTSISVKQNDSKSRDFTVGMGGAMGNPMGGPMGGGMANPMASVPGGMPGYPPQQPMIDPMTGMLMAGQPAGYGAIPGMPDMGGMSQMRGGFGMPPIGGALMGGAPMSGAGMYQRPPAMGGAVVIINKLNPELTTADQLFALFGVYGDVLRVKIMYNKRDTALILYNTPEQANLAVQNLNGCPLHGCQMMVNLSKATEIKMPRDDSVEGKILTQDYSSSDLHRYKLNSIPMKNVNPPSQVLHVANIHESTSATELASLFQTQQPSSEIMPVVEFFKTNKKLAYIGMSSVDVAVNAILNLHNHKIGGWPIRVAFSPKAIETLVPSA